MAVSDSVYQAAVQGRKEFRFALRMERQKTKRLLAVIAVGVWRLNSPQPCQVSIRDHSGYWPRGADGRCHIEDLQAATSTPNR